MRGFASLKSIGSFSAPAKVKCFLQNTHVTTLRGEIQVEHLDNADFVQTPDGDWAAVEWVGFKKIAPRLSPASMVNPICICAGALGDNVPSRDLFVSPDHGILVDGLMVDARVLTNGRSIFQVAKVPIEGFYYFHVEIEDNLPLLAENTPSESFISTSNNKNVDTANDAGTMYCEGERISSSYYLPETVKTLVRSRAVSIGATQSQGLRAAFG
ncbi:MAG: Hint domain-containing protein [Paracoccaceae bacterium]|nr:Hint domain-containing protein [Paracoccaceae bacterium]